MLPSNIFNKCFESQLCSGYINTRSFKLARMNESLEKEQKLTSEISRALKLRSNLTMNRTAQMEGGIRSKEIIERQIYIYAYSGIGNIHQVKKYKKDNSPLLPVFLTKGEIIISHRCHFHVGASSRYVFATTPMT